MRRIFSLVIIAVLTTAAYAQQNAVLSTPEAAALYRRSLQLLESTSAAVPGLVRAAAPVLENARQAQQNLENGPPGHAGLTYDLLINLRAYMALADSLPKPYPFPDEGRRQFAELRDAVERIESHFRATLDQKERQLRSPDRDNLRRYADDDAKLLKAVPGDKRIVFLGDSITDGWRLNEYFPNRDFVNRGISGQITAEMLDRMKADVIDLKPAAMLVLAGTNDIARGIPLSTIENNLTMIADLADHYKIKPLFASVLPISDYHKDMNPRYEMTKQRPPATILELNRWLETFCKQRHYPYVDYYSQMVDPAGYMKTDLADDGLHPNSAGYRVMGPIAMDAIERNLGRPAPPPPAAITSSSRKRVTKVRAPKPADATETALVPAEPVTPAPAPAAASTSATKKRVTKVPAPKPVEPVETAQAPVESAKPAPPPAPAVRKRTAPAAAAPAHPAPVAATPVKPAPAPKATADAKPAEAVDDAAKQKKKKESFWKRTYPSNPPPQ
jgi:lysophospholipase L1-like esterase